MGSVNGLDQTRSDRITGPSRGDVVLAFDGGGSKTDAVMADKGGHVLSYIRGPASNPQLLGWQKAQAVLDRLRSELMSGVMPSRVARTHVYLAGLDLPPETVAARTALSSWNADIIDNDIFALLRSGTEQKTAVAVVCGTGINAVGVCKDGLTIRYPALGDLSGDWGGGSFLGKMALWHAARAMDGRGFATILTESVPKSLGLATVSEVIEALHFGRLGSESYSRLTPCLFEAADAGDDIALSIVDRQAREIGLLISTTISRLEVQDPIIPVVLGGGVLASRNARLLRGVQEHLGSKTPQGSIAIVTEPPILGAGLAALESAGAGRDALQHYRSEIRARVWSHVGT